MVDAVGSVKQVVQVALKIKEAADTVQHNKEVCHQIRGRVNRLRAILSKLVDTDVLNDPATSGTLKDLEETLHRAYALIAACRVERNVVSLLFTAGKLSRKLRQVNDDILAQMAVASFGSNVQTSIMLTKHFQDTPKEPEQVELALLFQEDAEHVISSSCSHSQHSITLQGSDEIDGALEVQEPSRISKMLHTSLPWFTVFTYSQLRHATNKFSCTPGMGCSVYKGILHDGSQVVVKRISYYPPSCKEKCENELRTTAVLQHVNILKLIGCCRTKSELFHVYEFMKNGTLANHICGYTGSSLPWPLRFKIVEGVAQGLLYLHKQCGLSIIHLDIKPANIMLDDRYIPKIGDFGNFLMLPQFADEGETPCLRGTVGFVAPDLMTTGRFSAKSDVYSYGVLLLETVSGKSCLQADRNFNTLSAWVWHLWKSRKLIEVIDRQLLRGVADVSQTKEMKRCIHIALLCIELDPAHRPTASDVVRMLSDKRLKLPIPQQPAGTNENEDGSDSEQID